LNRRFDRSIAAPDFNRSVFFVVIFFSPLATALLPLLAFSSGDGAVLAQLLPLLNAQKVSSENKHFGLDAECSVSVDTVSQTSSQLPIGRSLGTDAPSQSSVQVDRPLSPQTRSVKVVG